MDLQVKLLMILERDYKVAVDFENNYSMGRRTRRMATRQYYSCELKDQGTFVVKLTPGS